MSKAEILNQLPKLQPAERRELLDRLYDLCEQDLLNGEQPSDAGKRMLEEELADYERDPTAGQPWDEVETEIRRSQKDFGMAKRAVKKV